MALDNLNMKVILR